MGRVLHASYSGYFPFCLSEGDPNSVGAGTAYPLGMSLENAMTLYWRIKSYRLTGMVNLSASAITIGTYPVYINSSVTATGAVSFGGGMAVSGNLGFYGTTPIAKPSGVNAVSNVVSLGLIASSATYGVLPTSIHTLTTTASINFGTVGGHSSVTFNVIVTGARTNDIVLLGLPSAVCASLLFYGHVTSDNTVEVDAVNGSNSSQTQSAQTFRISVIGYRPSLEILL